MNKEIWLPMKGYEGHYKVSNLGGGSLQEGLYDESQ